MMCTPTIHVQEASARNKYTYGGMYAYPDLFDKYVKPPMYYHPLQSINALYMYPYLAQTSKGPYPSTSNDMGLSLICS